MPFAHMYLGHEYFDTCQYPQALAEFSKVDLHRISEAQRPWRAAKMNELIICCKLRLDASQDVAPAIDALRHEYNALREMYKPVPEELARTLLDCRHLITDENRQSVMLLLQTSEFFETLSSAYPGLVDCQKSK
ncbi:MAG: hypothetical protein U5K76_12515 [Woeseiaceae bacterium]|nr:hypothetical protein [Woeseiaceae bacterium]